MKRQTSEERIKKAKRVHKNFYDYSKTDFSKVKEDTIVKCPIHGDFKTNYDRHVNSNQECPMCSHRAKITNEIFEKRANIIHNSKYKYFHDYINMHKKITFECPIHGIKSKQVQAHLRGQGCEECSQIEKQSKIEENIKNILIEKDILFEEQKHFEWLGLMSVDFYLPQYNTAIECQGIQHFEPRDFSGHNLLQAKLNFEIQKERDTRKYNLCKEHNLTLLYYSIIKPKEKYFSEVFNDKNKLINKIKNIN